jgi:hypothetical protein
MLPLMRSATAVSSLVWGEVQRRPLAQNGLAGISVSYNPLISPQLRWRSTGQDAIDAFLAGSSSWSDQLCKRQLRA